MLDEKPEWVAEERLAIAKDAINRAFDASTSLIKWVLTSVAVFHSAALVAGFNSEKFSTIMFNGPAWAFLIGIGLAVGSGLALAVGAADHAGSMTNLLWRGEGLESDKNEAFDPEPTRMIYFGALLLGLSIAAFLLGVGFAAYQINKTASEPQIQTDETK